MAFNIFRAFRGGAPAEAAAADHPLADDTAARGLVGQHPQGDEYRTAGPGHHQPEGIKFDGIDGIAGHGMLPERGLVENQTAGPDAMARTAAPGHIGETAHDAAGEPGKFFDVFLEEREAAPGSTTQDTAAQLKNVMVSSLQEDGSLDATARSAGPGNGWSTADDRITRIKWGDIDGEEIRAPAAAAQIHDTALAARDAASSPGLDATARTAGPGNVWSTADDQIPRLKFDGVDGEDWIRAPAAAEIHDTALAARDAGAASHGADATARTADPGQGDLVEQFQMQHPYDGGIRAPETSAMIHDTALAARDAGTGDLAANAMAHAQSGLIEGGFALAHDLPGDATARTAAPGTDQDRPGWWYSGGGDRDIHGTSPVPESSVIDTSTGPIQWARDEGPATLLGHAAGAADLASQAGDSSDGMSLNFEDVVHHGGVPHAAHAGADLPDGADIDIDPLDI